MTTTPDPFRIDIPNEVLDDLRMRLERVRWPDEPSGAGWGLGTNLSYMRDLVRYWLTDYDWRAQERLLNKYRQYTLPLDEHRIHFIHEPGEGSAPMPLLLSHGWPGSIVEYQALIPRLTRPSAFGGDPDDAFTVVAPSLPGLSRGDPDETVAAIRMRF